MKLLSGKMKGTKTEIFIAKKTVVQEVVKIENCRP